MKISMTDINRPDDWCWPFLFSGGEEYLYENLELADRYLPEPSAREIKEILTIQAEQYDVRRAAAYYKSIRYSYSSGGSSYGARPLNIRDFRSVPNFV